jgi:hypothetical protein
VRIRPRLVEIGLLTSGCLSLLCALSTVGGSETTILLASRVAKGAVYFDALCGAALVLCIWSFGINEVDPSIDLPRRPKTLFLVGSAINIAILLWGNAGLFETAVRTASGYSTVMRSVVQPVTHDQWLSVLTGNVRVRSAAGLEISLFLWSVVRHRLVWK